MPDYNLGRAHGEISITADTRGAQEAQAAMAAAAAEAELLDRQMGHVNRTFDENRKGGAASAEQIVKYRGEVEQLRVTYKRYQDDYERSSNRTREAQDRANQALRANVDDVQELIKLGKDIDRAKDEERKALRLATDSYDAYRNKVVAVKQEIDQFNRVHQEASNGLRKMRREVEQLGESLERMSSMLGSVARIVGTGGLMGMLGLASGGQLFASGSAGLSGLVSILGGALEIIKDFSGALLLLPGVINAGVVSLATLAVAFHGVGQAIGAIGDPAKFIEAIKDMGPITQQAMLQIQQFSEAFRGAREVVQESFFAQIVNDIQPLVQTWLPLLMNAGKEVAGQFGGMLHEVFAVFQDPAMQSGFQAFIQNFSVGLQAARGAIRPFLEAWNTLALVGSQAFERLGIALTNVLGKFNAWVQRSAESGKLTEWIDRALDAFTNMGHVIANIAIALNNVFNAARGESGGALENLVQLTAEFRAWTESVKGQNALVNFFDLLHAAVTVIRPEMKLLGESLAIVGGVLTRLGIALGPGITAFFTSFRDALASLAPNVLAIAPALNEFLTALGDTLLKIVQQIGPQLPRLFQGLADAFIAIAPILPAVASGLATILDHLSPGDIQGIFLAVLALKGLSTAFSGMLAVMSVSPIILVLGALTLLGIGVVLAYNHFKGFRDFINDLWPALQAFSSWLKNSFVNAWHSVGDAVQRAFSGAKNWAGELASSISTALSSIGGVFTQAWDDAYNWGHNLVQKIIDGMRDMLGPVGDIASKIMEVIKDPIPGSRARTGPFAKASPEEMGAKLAGDFAGGIESGSTGVGAASLSLASAASGGGGGIASLGNPGGTGNQGVASGKSGFDQAVTFLTQDLAAWSEIAQGAFGLFKDFSDIFVQTTKVVASIWNGGNNPLTQPGGIAGPPQAAPQATVAGVPNKPIPGVAPIPELAQVGGGPKAATQTDVAGVPSKPSTATGPVQGPTAPASTTGQAPASAPVPGDDALTAALKQRGVSDEQIRLIQGFSQTEGLNPAGNPTLGFMDSQLGGDTSLEGHVDALLQQFKDREGAVVNGQRVGPFPAGADDKTQAEWIASVVGQNSSPSGPDGLPQPARSDYVGRVVSALPARGATPAPQRNAVGEINARSLPPGMGVSEGLHPNTDLANRAVTAVFGDRIRALGGSIGGNRANDSGSGEHHGGALDIILGPLGEKATPERIALGNEIQNFLQQNQQAFGTQWTIWQDRITAAGGQPRQYRGLGDQGVTDLHYDHIHSFFGDPNVGGGTPDDQGTGMFNLPGGYQGPLNAPADTSSISNTFGQLGQGASPIDLPVDARGIGVAAAVGTAAVGALALRKLTGAARLRWLRFNYNRLDAKAKADVLKELSPGEKALIGKNPEIAFGAEGAKAPEVRGLVVDLGGDPTPKASIPGVPDEVSSKWSPEQRAWMDDLGRRPMVPGAALGNMSENEMGYASRLLLGQDAGTPPAAPDRIYNAENRLIPYNEAMGTKPITPATGTPAANAPVTSTGAEPANVTGTEAPKSTGGGVRGALGTGGRILGGALSLANAGFISYGIVGGAAETAQQRQIVEQGHSAVNEGSVLGIPANRYFPSPVSGEVESRITPADQANLDRRRAEGTTQPTSTPRIIGTGAQARQPTQGGLPGAQAERRGAGPPASLFGDAAAGKPQPVHVTNPQDLPGGSAAPPPKVRTAAAEGPLRPGDPGFIGPVATRPDQGPLPGAQRERRGEAPIPHGVGTGLAAGQPGPGPIADIAKPDKDTRSPIDKFSDTMSDVSSVAGDAFQVFNDVIRNIEAVANITDKLVRGVANTEDIFGQGGLIDEFQTFIKTAADISKLVGDAGGMAGGMSGGMDFGMGAAVKAVAGIVTSALEATNAAIDVGQQVYHEVTKYAGFIIGGFLGGDATGPLGGNVRMLLNTSTNQLYTYSEDNPLNKNTFNVPSWQRSYAQTPPPLTVESSVNIYAGPGQTPRDMMNETMWMVGTGNPLVASVSGSD